MHNQSTTNAGTDGSRPQLPRFSSQPPPIVSSSSGQGAQHTGSLTSSPAHNSGPSPWPVMPQQFTHGFQAPMQPYQSQGPYQFGDSLPPSNPSRYLPHPSMAPFNTTTGRPFGAHRHSKCIRQISNHSNDQSCTKSGLVKKPGLTLSSISEQPTRETSRPTPSLCSAKRKPSSFTMGA